MKEFRNFIAAILSLVSLVVILMGTVTPWVVGWFAAYAVFLTGATIITVAAEFIVATTITGAIFAVAALMLWTLTYIIKGE